MVTTRGSNSNADLLKAKFNDYIGILGSDSFTLIVKTETRNAAGRILTTSETTSTISGDLQWDSKLLKQYIDLGIAQSGDAIFYCKSSDNVVVHNRVEYDNVRYELIHQVEGEFVRDVIPYVAFIARRKPDGAS